MTSLWLLLYTSFSGGLSSTENLLLLSGYRTNNCNNQHFQVSLHFNTYHHFKASNPAKLADTSQDFTSQQSLGGARGFYLLIHVGETIFFCQDAKQCGDFHDNTIGWFRLYMGVHFY